MQKLTWVHQTALSERLAINQAADELAGLGDENAQLGKRFEALRRHAQAQDEEIMRLHAIVGVLATALVEKNVIDADALVTRVDTDLAELAPKPQGPPQTECVRCARAIPVSLANLTAKGYVCESCFLASGG